MCNHENIVVTHYTRHFEGEIGDRIACEIKCRDCNTIVYKYDKKDEQEIYSYDKYVQEAYRYIERNRNKIKSLIDLTCNNLNEKYKIADGLSN